MYSWLFYLFWAIYAAEHPLKIDKAAAAILTAVLCWTALILGAEAIVPLLPSAAMTSPIRQPYVVESLRHHLGEISKSCSSCLAP